MVPQASISLSFLSFPCPLRELRVELNSKKFPLIQSFYSIVCLYPLRSLRMTFLPSTILHSFTLVVALGR